jgi:hypothetical protein
MTKYWKKITSLVLIVSLVLLFYPINKAEAAIAFVNAAYNNDQGGGSSTTLTTPATNHSTGNFLLLIERNDSNVTPTVEDTAGNTYTKISDQDLGAGHTSIWYAKNIIGNANNVITMTFSQSVDVRQAAVIQYSGIDTSSPLDITSDVGNPSCGCSTDVTSSSFSTNSANELIVFALATRDTNTWTAGDIGGTAATLRGSPTDGLAFEDQIVSSIQSSITAAISWTPGRNYLGAVVTFKTPLNATGAGFKVILAGKYKYIFNSGKTVFN